MPEQTDEFNGGCARAYANQAMKALQAELVEVERVALPEYIIGRGILSYKPFESAIVEDFGQRFRPYTFSLWKSAAKSYEETRASNPVLASALPPLATIPEDYVPDYHNLDRLSDIDAGKTAVQNLVDLAKEGALKSFRGDFDVKPLSETQNRAEALIEDESVFRAISAQFDVPFDDLVHAQRLMLDALLAEQRSVAKSIEDAIELSETTKDPLEKAKAEALIAEESSKIRMVADMARFYTGLSQGNLSAAGRALRMAREMARLRRAGASGEAFVALFGGASMKKPVPLGMPEEKALATAEQITPAQANETVQKAMKAKTERAEAAAKKRQQSNRISGTFGARDIFGDLIPAAPATPKERSVNQVKAKGALRSAGVKKAITDTAALDRLAENAKRLKMLLNKQEGAC